MTSRKKPGLAFWATLAALTVLAVYPLSLGPVTLIWSLRGEPKSWGTPVYIAYMPVQQVMWHGPEWFAKAANAYLGWWQSLGRRMR